MGLGGQVSAASCASVLADPNISSREPFHLHRTIISYLTARPSRDIIVSAHQQLTVEWWENVRPKADCFISPFVIQEASRGDEDLARRRIEIISDLPILELNDEIRQLAAKYFVAINIPEKARVDAFHLSIAVWHEMDYLLSWNCKHIASGRVRKILQEMNDVLGISTPVICTPEELMEV